MMQEESVTSPPSLNWLGMEAPRYTSYPTAHHFTPEQGAPQMEAWLSALPLQTRVSAYVHIPYCQELCWFCGCHTKTTKRYEPVSQYVKILCTEIEQIKQQLSGKGQLVNIHFGGGSPSLLSAEDLAQVIEAIHGICHDKALSECAIELDPRTTSAKKIEAYQQAGINRVSLGLQDFDPQVQQAINRIQPYEQVADVMAALRHAGITQINNDLIYGLPQQTEEGFRHTLEQVITLNPSRLALFSYAHMPSLKKHQRLIRTEDLPSEPEKLKIYLMACEVLTRNGYVQIGIDHFARPEDPLSEALSHRTMRRNFQGYVTDDTDALIGMGCSAISQMPQGYAQNSAALPEYRNRVEAGQLAVVRGKALTKEDKIYKQVIDELMCFMDVDLAWIAQQHAVSDTFFAAQKAQLQQPQYQDIVEVNGNCLKVHTPYRMAARVVAAVFDAYKGVAAGRYSKVA